MYIFLIYLFERYISFITLSQLIIKVIFEPLFWVIFAILLKYNCHKSTLSLLSLFRLNPLSILDFLVRSSKIRYFCFAFLRLTLVKKEMKKRRTEKRNCKKPKIYDIFSLVVQSSEFSTEKSDSSSHKQ